MNAAPDKFAHQIAAAAREEPEHRNDRRRFLVWALMLGATTPAVATAQILQELEEEAHHG